jgi:hypothetical protein
MKVCRGVEVKLHMFLTLAPDGREWLASALVAVPIGKEPKVPNGKEDG